MTMLLENLPCRLLITIARSAILNSAENLSSLKGRKEYFSLSKRENYEGQRDMLLSIFRLKNLHHNDQIHPQFQ